MAENYEPLLVNLDLLQQAARVARARLERDPNDCGVLRSLADVYRKLGNLEEALAGYRRLLQLQPQDEEAAYLEAVLAGTACRTAPRGLRAAPFVVLKDFLPPPFHDGLIPLLVSLREKLAPSLLGDGQYVPNYRDTLDFMEDWEGRKRFNRHLRAALPQLLPRLGLEAVKLGGVETYLRAYLDGHFFKVHMDAPPASPRGGRVISFVYYFHARPRPYTGGELVLFDSDIETTNEYTTARFTSIVPEDNTLVLFPSRYYHCVLPVHCPSRRFEDSRFCVNGFIHRAAGAKSVPGGAADAAVSPAAQSGSSV